MDNQDERALNGKMFDAGWPDYAAIKARAHDLCRGFNLLDEQDPERFATLCDIFDEFGEDGYVRGPLQVNVGTHTRIGARFFANFNLMILDDVAVTIGDDVQFGPGVSIIAGSHPLLFEERKHMTYPDGHIGLAEFGDPINIESHVWLGANVTVFPGVTIGHDAVVGAESVVTKDLPAGWLCFGTPCMPIREIGPEDSLIHGPRW